MKNIHTIFNNNKIYHYLPTEVKLIEGLVEGMLDAKTVVFYSVKNNEKLSAEDKSFLLKLLGAVQHNLDNSLLINNTSKIQFNKVKALGNVERIIFFGSTRKDLAINLDIKRYKRYQINNVDCLFVDRLDVLKDDKKRKSVLWGLMKEMFKTL